MTTVWTKGLAARELAHCLVTSITSSDLQLHETAISLIVIEGKLPAIEQQIALN